VNYRPLRLGTRRSPMAIAQSRQVAGMITTRTGMPVEIAGLTTLGNVSRSQLAQLGGTGVFVSALREALLAGEVDLAVHSAKDLPAGAAAGIVLAAVPTRDDPRDALVAREGAKLADLPAGARIGTGSPRRAAQLLRLRGDLRCVPIRGNADTRLGKVGEGELEGVVLGHAGLTRLGCVNAVTQVFELDEMLPAPGPGALAVEWRDGEPRLAALLGAVRPSISRRIFWIVPNQYASSRAAALMLPERDIHRCRALSSFIFARFRTGDRRITVGRDDTNLGALVWRQPQVAYDYAEPGRSPI